MTIAGAGVRRLARAALVAGLVAAAVEMVFVLPIQALALHNSPELVFQAIAMGAIGRAAFDGGWTTAVEGMFWHLLVSVAFAALYVFAARRWRVLLSRPVLGGTLLGVVAYVVMIFMVIPLSRIGFTMPKANVLTLISFAIHLFGFGVPVALVVRAMLGPRRGPVMI